MKSKYQLITEGLTMTVIHRAVLSEDWDVCLCISKVTDKRVFAVLPSWMIISSERNEMSFRQFLKCSAEIVHAPSNELTDSQCHALMTGLLNNNTHDRFRSNLNKWHAIGLIQDAINGDVWHKPEALNYRTGVGKFS